MSVAARLVTPVRLLRYARRSRARPSALRYRAPSLILPPQPSSPAALTMSSMVGLAGTSPYFTGALLWSLTLAPTTLRHPVLAQLERLLRHAPVSITARGFIHGLSWLFAAGVVRTVNSWLNAWALNHWQLRNDGHRWQWRQEIAVVTGGSGGIGALVVAKLAGHGVRVVILDVQSPSSGDCKL